MQSSFGVNTVALVKGAPKLLTLKDIIKEFYEHRREVVLRRTSFLLRKAEQRAHLLLGLKTAVENADAVVEIIKKASDVEVAKKLLMESYALSEVQAKAILEMKLARLTGLEREKIIKEYEQVVFEIKELKAILTTPQRVTEIVLEELKEVADKFGSPRKTKILVGDADLFTIESLISNEPVAVTITQQGYVKRTAMVEISAQRRWQRQEWYAHPR